MKQIVLRGALLFAVIQILTTRDSWAQPQSTDDDGIKEKLEAFEKGTITLKELTEESGNCQKLIIYYFSNTNVSVKAKLPIGRCFAMAGEYKKAADLAVAYIQVYSNDWQGWKILGAANLLLGNFSESLAAYTNAVNYGDENCSVPLAFAALKLKRLDIFSNTVPELLILRQKGNSPETKPLDIAFLLAGYSIDTNQKELFIEALNGITSEQVLSRDDLTCVVKAGCRLFDDVRVNKIFTSLESISENKTNTTSLKLNSTHQP